LTASTDNLTIVEEIEAIKAKTISFSEYTDKIERLEKILEDTQIQIGEHISTVNNKQSPLREADPILQFQFNNKIEGVENQLKEFKQIIDPLSMKVDELEFSNRMCMNAINQLKNPQNEDINIGKPKQPTLPGLFNQSPDAANTLRIKNLADQVKEIKDSAILDKTFYKDGLTMLEKQIEKHSKEIAIIKGKGLRMLNKSSKSKKIKKKKNNTKTEKLIKETPSKESEEISSSSDIKLTPKTETQYTIAEPSNDDMTEKSQTSKRLKKKMNFEKKDHNQYTAKWKGKKVPNIDQRHDSGKLRKDMKKVMHEFIHQLNQKDNENKNVN